MTAAGPYRPLRWAHLRGWGPVAHRTARVPRRRPAATDRPVPLVWCWECSRYVHGPATVHELDRHRVAVTR